MLSAIHGVVNNKNRPPIPPRIPRSRSDERSPSPRMSSLIAASVSSSSGKTSCSGPSPPTSLPRVAFSRSISDTTLYSTAGTSSVRGICLDLKDTPKPPTALKRGNTPHSVKKSNKKLPDSLMNLMHRKNPGSVNKSSPRTVSFALTPSTTVPEYNSSYPFDGLTTNVPMNDQERWDSGLGAQEWDPNTNPLMGLAMLTEHLSSNFSPPSKKRTISQVDLSSSSSSSSPAVAAFFPDMVSGSIPSYTSSVVSRSSYTAEMIESLTQPSNLKIHIPELNGLDSEDEICSSTSDMPNFKLPPRKRHLQEQPIAAIAAGGYQ